ANACTGVRGLRDAQTMAQLAANGLGLKPGEVLVASTGIIGRPLPMDKVKAGVQGALARMGRSAHHASRITQAIMTTDTRPKTVAVRFRLGGCEVRLGGITKGAGMIAPGMATTLCFLTTDTAITAPMLQRALRVAIGQSFNAITVDGHMSTNDTAVILANGVAGNRLISAPGRDFQAFQAALSFVALRLAQAIVRDGEGATKFVEILVRGAKSDAEARRAARAIADSALVKTALNGGDPNWGRIVSAAGYAGIVMREERASLRLSGVLVYEKGLPIESAVKPAAAKMKAQDIRIVLDLGLGAGQATVWTCDLSHGYVTINAEYHT
ncbi:MAG: bifunctional glutamate N-acetyltransferase/amino-acid acetyltransferase ArgJ, partial [Planctomycetes bacterium]|nr:bifunctional glutamate N-acetyltransferase/amino-acid acetyltransferase ArgJ [Planctomycetota bacterium]